MSEYDTVQNMILIVLKKLSIFSFDTFKDVLWTFFSILQFHRRYTQQ